MKHLYALLFLLCVALSGFAQPYMIKGAVTDTLNAAYLHRSSVTIIRTSDSVIEAFTRTDANGRFELKLAKPGKYILQITFPSFADYVEVITVKNNTTDLGAIPMVSKEHLLKEFILTKQIAAIKIKGDTTEFMADSFKVKEGSNVEDLLKKLPGIQVDKNGQITAQGETVQKVLVDGEEFFSDDPKVVTQGLQANAVEKVQVYDKKSDQAEFTGIDDGQKTKTINLELKENKKKGYFGKLDLGGGSDGYFQNQAMINAFRGKRQVSAFGIASNTDKIGLGWGDNDKFGGGNNMTEIDDDGSMSFTMNNYDDFGGWNGSYSGTGLPKAWTGGLHFANKWNADKDHLSANYRYARQQVEVDGTNIKQYALSGDTTRVNTERKNQFSRTERQSVDGSYEWKIDTLTTIRFTTNAGIKKTETATNFHTETLNRTNSDGPATINNRYLTGNTNAQFINSDLLLLKKFKKKGRTFSLDMKQNYKDSKGDGFLNSVTGDGIPADSQRIDQKKINNTNTQSYAAKATYTEPLSKKTNLEFDYGVTVNNSTSLYSSYDKSPVTNAYTVFKDSVSSDYGYNILSNSGGASFKYAHKKINFAFGSDVTNTDYLQTDILHGDTSHTYSYINLFPKASFTYKMAKQSSLSFTYQGNTNQPTINQIQPLNQNTDPLNISIGNPALKQEFTNRFSLRFNDYKVLSHRYLYGHLSFTNTADAISTSQVTNGAVYTTQYVNVDGNYSGNGYAGYGFKITKINLDVSLSVNSSVNHINNFVNYKKNTSNNASYTFTPGFSFDKEDKYSFSFYPDITYNNNTSTINTIATSYFVTNSSFQGNVQLPKKFEINSSIDVMIRQKTPIFTDNNQVTTWNAYVAKKFLKKGELTVKAAVYDILNQNRGYKRTAQGNTISQDSYNTIRRYALLSLVWNITHSPVAAAAETK